MKQPYVTRYQEIAAYYRAALEKGVFGDNERLPSVRAIMNAHAVSLSTAVQACRQLEAEGLVQARERSGYYVVARPVADVPEFTVSPLLQTLRLRELELVHRPAELLTLAQHRQVHVDLGAATCAPQLYPADELRRLTSAVLREDPYVLASPASARGGAALRQAIARRAVSRGVHSAPEEVIVTSGCSEALTLALRAVTKPGDTVMVESPTYYGFLQLIRALGATPLEMPTSVRGGLTVEAVEFALSRGTRVTAIICMPTLHNPLGSIMPLEARKALVRLCEKHNIALIEDDVYGDMYHEVERLKALKAWDTQGQVIYCSSFNKCLSPGLRLGWLLGGKWHDAIEHLKMATGRPKEELPQRIAARYLAGGAYERYLRRLHNALRVQRCSVIEAIHEMMPEGTFVHEPPAGIHLWVQLPPGVSSTELFMRALDEHIRIVPGAVFSESQFYDAFIRISCGWPLDAKRLAALHTLGMLCRKQQAV
ncbi:PLP-dependent aminotransferase family protein [Azotobacter chroococcum]|uniref:aminotransferase-like domain-containing protein n=1 Tax=Azotobacter chroococcum TaxID=353 RepID=UPI0010395841|nr:PLP-dependent aminotransferase family protein [Azotobacter chroococcum]TBW34002.1 PLP-dependent aminotransferase family protein [Azotobacter chroococcum]